MPTNRLTPWFAGLVAALILSTTPTQAIVILDSTWKANGGAPGKEAQGFEANAALAQQPQFAGAVSIAVSNGAGSGTWIGDDPQGHAYILTAAHLVVDTDDKNNFVGVEKPKFVTALSDIGGQLVEYPVTKIAVHPEYDPKDWASPDLALIVLDRPFAGGGTQPMLYCGVDELGQTGTIVGYGMRGVGSVGEDPAYQGDLGAGKLAAHNRIDAADFEEGGSLTIDFDPETGNTSDAFGQANAKPVDQYEGIPSNGDSGAPLWIETKAGWEIAGVVKGGPASSYESPAALVRLTGFQDWLHQAFPQALFNDGFGSNCNADVPVTMDVGS